jgi:hypothetical protein
MCSNVAKKMNAVITAMTFAARHLLIVPIAIVAGCIVWTIIYVILLLAAIIFNQGVGGPLAYPAGIIAIVVPTVVIGWGIFAPASAVGAIVCALLKLPRLAAIPIVTAAAFGLSYLLYWGFIELVTTHSMPSAAVVLKNFAMFLSIPLGIYWWITEGPGSIIDAFRRWFRHRRAQNNQANKTAHPTAGNV